MSGLLTAADEDAGILECPERGWGEGDRIIWVLMGRVGVLGLSVSEILPSVAETVTRDLGALVFSGYCKPAEGERVLSGNSLKPQSELFPEGGSMQFYLPLLLFALSTQNSFEFTSSCQAITDE